MTDRELLEMAAKAVGIAVEGYGPNGVAQGKNGPCLIKWWNPLTDDGDALRLAVDLRLLIDLDYNSGVGCGSGSLDEIYQEHRNDKYADTRRAIVRAAAEIGRAMP